jgi:hypothetical protein
MKPDSHSGFVFSELFELERVDIAMLIEAVDLNIAVWGEAIRPARGVIAGHRDRSQEFGAVILDSSAPQRIAVSTVEVHPFAVRGP